MVKALLGVLLLLPAAADETFTVRGKVSFNGPVPDAKPNKAVLGDQNCAALHAKAPDKDDLVVDAQGGVKWAFVWVKTGLPAKDYPVPAEPVVLTQKGCVYQPHVFGILAGQTLEVRNGDPLLHNVHALPFANPAFNRGQPVQGQVDRFKFTQTEVPLLIKCDVHPWMKAWACVVEHPFHAVTDAAGNFEIKNLPAGNYTIGVWHEGLNTVDGKNEAAIQVKADGRIDFVMANKPKQ